MILSNPVPSFNSYEITRKKKVWILMEISLGLVEFFVHYLFFLDK